MAVAFAQVIHEAVDLLVGSLDLVAGDLRQLLIVDVERLLGSDFEDEDKLVGMFEIHHSFVVHWQRFAKGLDVVFADILVEFVNHHAVHFVGDERLLIHFLNHRHGGVARAEAGDLCHSALLFQCIFYVCCVIFFADFNGDQLNLLALFFVLNLHV